MGQSLANLLLTTAQHKSRKALLFENFMSVRWMNIVWELSAQKGSILLTELAIADNANDAGVAWPGYGTLARKTRLSERNVLRVVDNLESAQEVAIHRGGAGRRSTNIYVLLLGRTAEEIETITTMLKKGVNLSSLKAGQFVYLDKLSKTKKCRKGDTAMSPEPSGTMNDHGWMNDDPICVFLNGLPGFNQDVTESTRREIVAHHYDLKELPYLWNECALADNPIGLFTHKVSIGQHSVDCRCSRCAVRRSERRRPQIKTGTFGTCASARVRQGPPPIEADHRSGRCDSVGSVERRDPADEDLARHDRAGAVAQRQWPVEIEVPSVPVKTNPHGLKRMYKRERGEAMTFVFIDRKGQMKWTIKHSSIQRTSEYSLSALAGLKDINKNPFHSSAITGRQRTRQSSSIPAWARRSFNSNGHAVTSRRCHHCATIRGAADRARCKETRSA
jgi:hypothetical protein